HAGSIAEAGAFWAELARSLAWYLAPAINLESLPDGTDRWFADGRLNSAYLALDGQFEEGRGELTALIYD
ncbi:acetyl-coenzyme A synthetase N-terminal domain-containing protein, partial [Pseudomonas aeruginosa]|uniref:acetyl-coenzyme A synthetase N-terminal domain-containing protein n=1 Tax=Pseudomonas aeruginosa TaxID=287 RepID=UPI003F7CE778